MSAPVCNTLTAVLFVLFAFLLFYRVDEVPIPYHADEAGAVYDALSMANYHCDRFMVRFPVYFMNYGTHGSSAMYGYFAALMIKLFGYSITTVRLPAIILSLLSACVFTFIVRREAGNLASVICLALFCILPFSIMHSRWGLDAFLLFPMMMISCSVFYYSVSCRKIIWFFISGLLFGLTLYSYSVSYILVPIFLGSNLLYLLVCRRIKWKQVIVMSVPLFLLAVPLMLMMAINNGFLPEIRTRFFSIPKLESYGVTDLRIKNIIDNLSFTKTNVFYRIFVDDLLIYNVIPRFGTMHYISVPLIVYGLILSLKKTAVCISEKRYNFDVMMTVLFFSVLGINIITENTNVNRLCVLYMPMIWFLVVSILEIMKRRKTAAIAAAGIYLVLFSLFVHYYFGDYEKELDKSPLIGSIIDLKDALLFAESVNQYDETIYVLDPLQTYVYVLIIKDIDPFTFNKEKILSYDDYVKVVGKYRFRLDAVMPECVYIFRDWNKMPDDLDSFGFETRQFGSFWVYFPKANK